MLDPSFTLFGKRIQVNGEIIQAEVEKSCLVDQLIVQEVITEEESMAKNEAEMENETENAPDETEKKTDSEKPEDEKESSKERKKELKKPDKIIPCPRCTSMETKFCYYNNYNVNQPRHFCKKCQRYWTAGGTMRNVPVGAGRRKNKTSSGTRFCQFTVSEPLQDQTNTTVLKFGPENNISDCSTGSSITTVVSKPIEEAKNQDFNFNGVFQNNNNQMQCFQFPYIPFYPMPMPIYPHHYFPCPPPPQWLAPQTTSSLGKRFDREESNSVVIPKTLRIDDPDEAARSSIWNTLGIKKGESETSSRKGFFNSVVNNSNKGGLDGVNDVVKANPVALCRSFTFQERA